MNTKDLLSRGVKIAPSPNLYEEAYFTREAYPGGYRDYPLNDIRFNTIMRLGKPESLLDVGCGYGYLVKRAVAMGIPAIGMDISRWCEKQAEKILPPGHFIRHDIQQWFPFKDLEFDLLYCEGVLEHIDENRIDFVLAEMARVAKKRMLAITFGDDAIGHVCNHDSAWWIKKIPAKTWLYMGKNSTDVDPDNWYYKKGA